MKEKRRDSKERILHTGESQRTDGKYLYKYVDAFGNTKYVYAWRLTPTDPTPKGKREKPSLRELEQQIRRDVEDGIDSTGKKMTLCQLYAKQNVQRANVKKSTQKQREQLMRLLKEDKFCLLYTSGCYSQHVHYLFQRIKGRIIHATFNLGKALHIDTDFVRQFLLFHSSVFSYGLYVFS